MKYTLILMLSLYSIGAASQARVGIPIDEIRKDFPQVQKLDSTTYHWETNNADVYYITNGGHMVLETVIYPKSVADERIYMNFYNKRFTREGYAQWRYVDEEKDTVYIYRINRPNGGPYFLWTYYPNLNISRDVKPFKK